MSASTEPDPPEDPPAPGANGGGEEIDALPVLAEEATVLDGGHFAGALAGERRSTVMIPAVQAAAVAAGGFVAGAAVVGLVHRRQRHAALSKGRRSGRELGRRRRAGRAGELVQIVGSRSLLVDVHLLGGSGADG
jgi:hypothetical protein